MFTASIQVYVTVSDSASRLQAASRYYDNYICYVVFELCLNVVLRPRACIAWRN